MITIGIISVILDYILLNISTFRLLFFPMFSLAFLISSIVFKLDIKITLIILVIYSLLSGLIFYNITILLLIYYLINKKTYNYYLLILLSLILYDIFLYLLTTTNIINNLNILIYKVFITLPINLLYSCILLVLNKKINKYKLI